MAGTWDVEQIMALTRAYQGACVLAAAGELDVFSLLARGPLTAQDVAGELGADGRGMEVLLDALAALELLEKHEGCYTPAPGTVETLSGRSPGNMLAMVQHQANCLRRWGQLAMVVKTGQPAAAIPSVRGPAGDQASFIAAMHCISEPMADRVIADLGAIQFKKLLDLGGASGTWTLAFLRAHPQSKAVIFDLPAVIPMAAHKLEASAAGRRIELVPGDFYKDPLPTGADLAWVSAIVHQNSRQQNRDLFLALFKALEPGGRVLIRDIVMDSSRIKPTAGALFAVNMLVATPGGGNLYTQRTAGRPGFGRVQRCSPVAP